MKVGFVAYGSVDTCTGGYLYDRQLIDYLLSEGDEVDVVSLPWRNYARHLTDNLSSKLVSRLEAAEYDVLVQDELAHPSLFGVNRWLRARSASRFPIVTVVHLLRSTERRTSPLHRLYAAVERCYLASVDGAVFNCDTTRGAVDRLLGGSLPGVVALPGNDHVAGPGARATNGHGPLRLLSVANVLPGKGHGAVVEALARVPSDQWRLTIVGSLTADKAYAARLQRQVRTAGLGANVDLTGEVTNDEVPRYLESHDVLVMPSSYEALGIAYLEAMRYGLPVVATTAGGAREVVTHGREGFLVEPGDVRGLTDLVRRMAADRGLVTDMGRAAARRAARHPTWKQSFDPARDFLAALVEGRQPRGRQATPS